MFIKNLVVGLIILSLTPVTALASEINPFQYIEIKAPAGQVLGASTSSVTTTCDTALLSQNQSGFFGSYYNMSATDAGMNKSVDSFKLAVADNNYWYTPQYLAFTQIDTSLNFGKDFYPVNTGLAGDPNNFGVHWRAVMIIPKDGLYTFNIAGDDDSWLKIDNAVVINNGGGASRPRSKKAQVNLTAGTHQIDVYFAQRGVSGSYFTFTDNHNLTYYPLTTSCTANDFTQKVGGQTSGTQSTKGKVLGASHTYSPYTKAIALYKTADSTAVYAIFANGYRHYVSSPAAFKKYGYRYTDIKTVSAEKLAQYPDARLVRTPNNDTIYLIANNAQQQWLKLAIPSSTAFVSYPDNEWGDVLVIDELDLNSYPDANLISANKSKDIYFLNDGVKQKFASKTALQKLDYNIAEVVAISTAHLDAYQTGEILR